ncbi:N-acetylglucosamine-6-phosphate deacetylase [Bacillus niameyensis]|uniref:N-acetylglucosamine-6-phosphate deacetylase n=1 Tax=Bacillus niameyensis TaxID=1522308 RepID=UPI000785E806|nr:N-acetylglucosamine-6-phosphate deacetylase [Bacillus niameyensis]
MEADKLFVVNAQIFTPEKIIMNGWLIIDQTGKIESIGEGSLDDCSNGRVYDAGGCMLLPGLIDIHIHGGAGYSVMDATYESLAEISKFHVAHGTTSFLATTNTQSKERIVSTLKSASKAMELGVPGSDLIGIHLEGPFIDEEKRGAQSREHIRVPNSMDIDEFLKAANNQIKLVTLAPEVKNGLAAVRQFKEQNVTVSIGHSNATLQDVKEAIKAGANHTTHHFNGMSAFHHREPGVAGAGLIFPELTVEIIADGFHVHPELVKWLFDVKGVWKICAITDAVFCAGLPDGEYHGVFVENGQVFLKDGHNLAGSTLTMIQAFKNVLNFTGCTIEQILPAFTLVPAQEIKIDHLKGSLEIGKDADFLIVDKELSIISTFVRGKEVYKATSKQDL